MLTFIIRCSIIILVREITKQEREVNKMFTVIAKRNDEVVEKKYSMYFQALTVAIELQNKNFIVEIKRA